MSEKQVVTRFAPSPTGYLHIGSARTALFAWAFARQQGGRFIIRLEDTDRARSTAESAKNIVDSLRWLEINWDEGPSCDGDVEEPFGEQVGGRGPYCQSERLGIYREYVDKLLANGKAYKCYMSREELAAKREEVRARKGLDKEITMMSRDLSDDAIAAYEAEERGYVVRFKMGNEDITFHDEVRGDVTVKADLLDDFVIWKADGFPTYHLAVVVDDALMGVTHVLRAQDHVNNTPKHCALQEALGFERPVYAHMSLIFNPDGSKMSKRDKAKVARKAAKEWLKANDNDVARLADEAGLDVAKVEVLVGKKADEVTTAEALSKALKVELPDIDVCDFERSGYLPGMLCNYMSLLGWSPGEDIEKFDMAFLVERFSFDRMVKANSKFDREKLFRFNADAIAELSGEEFARLLHGYCEKYERDYIERMDEAGFKLFAGAYHARSRTLKEACEMGRFIILGDDEIEFDARAVKKVLMKNNDAGFAVLDELRGILEGCEEWSVKILENILTSYANEKELGMGGIAQPLRVAVTGSTVSPPIFETLELLGRESTLVRIERCLVNR